MIFALFQETSALVQLLWSSGSQQNPGAILGEERGGYSPAWGGGRLHGQPLRLNKKASGEDGAIKPSYESGANLFIGNLDPEVRETVWCGNWGGVPETSRYLVLDYGGP